VGGCKCANVFVCLACCKILEKNDHVQGATGQGKKGGSVPSFMAHHVQAH